MHTPHICLSMIVKNEAPVIARCLASVRPWIHHWVIVDTGSSDGTQALVRAAMQGVPGELHERPWRNFAHNRNEALELARAQGDFVLFIDADEQLQMPVDFVWPALEHSGYMFRCLMNGWSYARNSLIAAHPHWRWEGVLHEYLTTDQPHQWHTLAGPTILVSHDGARARDPSTYRKDIEVLRQALADAPQHTRYTFYLAQSYRDAGMPEDSLRLYQQRLTLGGWAEELWFSAFQIAVLSERLNRPDAEIQRAYLAAYAMRTHRAEPLCELARYLRLRGEYALAHLYALRAAALPLPQDMLFVDASVYSWRALDELASSAWYAGAHADGRQAMARLLAERNFPATERARIEANQRCYD